MPYDEFGLFSENAAEYDLPYSGPPEVRRVDVEVSPGRKVSSLVVGHLAPNWSWCTAVRRAPPGTRWRWRSTVRC